MMQRLGLEILSRLLGIGHEFRRLPRQARAQIFEQMAIRLEVDAILVARDAETSKGRLHRRLTRKRHRMLDRARFYRARAAMLGGVGCRL